MVAYALEHAFVGHEIFGWQVAVSECFAESRNELPLADAVTLLLHMRAPSETWGNQRGDLLHRRERLLLEMSESGFITASAAKHAAVAPLNYCGKQIASALWVLLGKSELCRVLRSTNLKSVG